MRYRHQVVDVERLSANPWNPNMMDPAAEKKLDESIKRLGVFKPIIVRELPDKTLEIIGGQHRWESARRLGMADVPVVNLGDIDDKIAKEIGLADNGRYGHDDAGLLAQVFKDLDVDDLSTFLPFDSHDLDSIFAASAVNLDDLSLDDDDEIDLGGELETEKKPPTHTIMRFKVPVLDAELLSEKLKRVMNEQGFTKSDSLTNAGDALVFLLGNNDE